MKLQHLTVTIPLHTAAGPSLIGESDKNAATVGSKLTSSQRQNPTLTNCRRTADSSASTRTLPQVQLEAQTTAQS